MKESITCIAFDIYNIIKDVQFALKAADFVLTIGSIGAAVFSGGTAAAAGAVLKQLLKEFAEEMLKKGIIKRIIKKVILPLIEQYVRGVDKALTLRIFKVLSGCVTAGFDLDSSHSRTLWKDVLLDPALNLPRQTVEDFLDGVW